MTSEETLPANVLIVDDEEKNLRLIGTILKSYGYQFETAGSGPEALEKAAAPFKTGCKITLYVRHEIIHTIGNQVQLASHFPD